MLADAGSLPQRHRPAFSTTRATHRVASRARGSSETPDTAGDTASDTAGATTGDIATLRRPPPGAGMAFPYCPVGLRPSLRLRTTLALSRGEGGHVTPLLKQAVERVPGEPERAIAEPSPCLAPR